MHNNVCTTAFEAAKKETIKHSNWIDSPWPGEEGEGGRERKGGGGRDSETCL